MSGASNYRPDIDGLRAIAVILVIAFHAFPDQLRSGFIGVDIFFVISGYLITSIIAADLKTGTFSFQDFYSKRVRRIFPALTIVLVATVAMGICVLQIDQLQQLLTHVFGGTTFSSNFLLYGESGYFDGAADEKSLLHLWSLAIEEQFYLIWPILLVVAWKARVKLTYLTYLIFLSALASFAASLYLTQIRHDSSAAFYLPYARVWELMIGAVLSTSFQQGKATQLQPELRAVAGSFLLGIGVVLIDSRSMLGFWWALLPTVGTVLLISAGPNAAINRYVLSNKALISIGLISYPLYLWHWPLLTMLRLSSTSAVDSMHTILAIAVSFLLAWITYRVVELRVRRNRAMTSRLVVFMVVIGVVSHISSKNMDMLVFEYSSANVATDNLVARQFTGHVGKFEKNPECLTSFPFPQAEKYGWWFCVKSTPNLPTILLLGNSFANQMYPGMATNKDLAHHTVLSIGTCDASGSPWVDSGANNQPCADDRQAQNQIFIDSIIKNNKSIKYVFVDGLSNAPTATYIASLQNRLDFLNSQGVQVIIFKPHIQPGFHTRACFEVRSGRKPRNCTFNADVRLKIASEFQPLVDSISKSHPKTLFFDQNEMYCPSNDGRCSYIRDGMPLYRDENHISEFGAIKLAEYFVKWANINAPTLLNVQ